VLKLTTTTFQQKKTNATKKQCPGKLDSDIYFLTIVQKSTQQLGQSFNISRAIITHAFVTSHFDLQDLVPGTGFPPKPQDKNSGLSQDFSGPAFNKKISAYFCTVSGLDV